jgi:hypothetical protein
MQYMARVEIHNASRETYDRLHSAMEAQSFSRTLTKAGTGERCRMPIGAYWIESSGDAWSVLDAAKRAALPIDWTAEIVIAGAGPLVFYNCPGEDPYSGLAGLYALMSTTPSAESYTGFLGSILGPLNKSGY